MTVREYNKCVDLYADSLYRFAIKNIRDEEKAKDIVQESFLKLWEKISEIQAVKVKSYLFTTTYHNIVDEARKQKVHSRFENYHEKDKSLEDQPYDVKEILNEAVERLPEVQRSVIMLRDYEGYSYKEIGEITNLKESQVKVYIYRARTFLKEYLVSPEKVL